MSDQPQSLRFGQILGLPRVEQIVDHREETFLGRIPRLRQIVIEMRLVDGLHRCFDVRVGREQDAPRQRVHLARFGEHFAPQHAGHALIADQHGQRIAAALQFAGGGQRLLSRRRAHHRVVLPVPGAEIATHSGEHLRIVVHDEQDGLVHRVPPAPSISASGRATRNSVRPGSDSTEISPSLWRTRRRTMSRPRPVPCPTGLVVKNGSKMRSRICAGMPAPLSTTRTTTLLMVAVCQHLDAARVGDGVEGIVDQVHPDLVEFAGEAANARKAGFNLDRHGDRFRPRLRLQDRNRVAQTLRQVHRFGDRRLIHVRESLDRQHQARDAHRGFLNLRGEAAYRTSGGGPSQHGIQRRSIDGRGQLVERLERHRRVRQAPRRPRHRRP